MSKERSFSIKRYLFNEKLLSVIDSIYYLKDNWPIIYILSNDTTKHLYVGETSDFYTRITTHLRNADKKRMSAIHIITCDGFNKSATLDIESNLIKYISADKHWKLLNLNIGLSNHNYYQKTDKYWQLFIDIWDALKEEAITFNSIVYIDNSNLFKYSPFKSLNAEQYKGLFRMMEILLSENRNVIIAEGGAGTGKSLLAIHLFKLLMTDIAEFNFRYFGNEEPLFIEMVRALKQKYENPKIALVVPMTSFRETIKKVFRNVQNLKASMVIGPSEVKKKHYDIIIVDEAHRLRRGQNLGAYIGAFNKTSEALAFNETIHTELNWVMKQSNKLILFYDEKQTIRPSDIISADFDKLKALPGTERLCLKKQMRVLGGEKYVKFITDLLDCTLAAEIDKFTSKKYDFLLFDSVTQMRREIQRRDAETGLSRMVAGYSWEWVSKENPELFDILLENESYRWNSPTKDWINSKNAPNEIGCIHTTQGYDLNYAGIIFGREISYDKDKNEIVIIEENYCDKVGKAGISNTWELKVYIINIYRTILQRSIKGAYVYAFHPALKEYFSRFIPKFNMGTNTILDTESGNSHVVPLYSFKAAAGSFNEFQKRKVKEHIALPGDIKYSSDLFACRVEGESMNKIIPNGAICLFRMYSGGSRNGQIVLAHHSSMETNDVGAGFTVKEYQSIKVAEGESWTHSIVKLVPRSNDPDFKEIVLSPEEIHQFKILAIFVRVLY